MFETCGLFGILYALPLFWFVRNSPAAQNTAPASTVHSLGELLGNRNFILLALYFTLPAMAGWIVRDWMPAILKAEFGIGQGKAGVSATIYWMLAAVAAAYCGGLLADRWTQSNIRGRTYTSAIGVACMTLAMLGVGYSPQTGSLWVAVAFLALFGIGWGFFDTNNMPILCQIVGPHLRATGYGFMNMISISCGGLADWGFGRLRDLDTPLALIFATFAAVSALSILLVLAIRPNAMMRVSS
jgi:fucose permease